jgi:hypothetical protein
VSRARFTAVALAVALLGACSGGGDDDGAAATSTSTSTTVTDTERAPVPSYDEDELHAIGATFQSSLFIVTIGDAVYDADRDELRVGVRFENIGERWATPEPTATLLAGGRETPMYAPVVEVPAGATVDVTASFSSIGGDPFDSGVIVWARDGQDQPEIDLATGEVDGGDLPTPVAVDVWGRTGKFAVHVHSGRVLAGALGTPGVAPEGTRVLRLDFDLYTSRLAPVSGFAPTDHLSLRRPDGEVVRGIDGSTPLAPMSWTAGGGCWIEFPITGDVEGRYELLLASIGIYSLVPHPELVEDVAIPIDVELPERAVEPEEEVPPRPVPPPDPATAEVGSEVDRELGAGSVNVPGFDVRPTRLRWDPATREASVDAEVTYLQTESNHSDGLLSAPPQLDVALALVSRGRLFSGIVDGAPTIEGTEPTAVRFVFQSVDDVDPDDAGLYIGSRDRQASSLPLGEESAVTAYPPPIREGDIDAPAVAAGDWSVALKTYRVGLVQTSVRPASRQVDFEVTFDVTASPTAHVGALGLRFRPAGRLFIAGADGYLTQAATDSGQVELQPGETRTLSATFHVIDTYAPSRLGFALRSGDERQDFAITQYVETTFGASFGAATPEL